VHRGGRSPADEGREDAGPSGVGRLQPLAQDPSDQADRLRRRFADAAAAAAAAASGEVRGRRRLRAAAAAAAAARLGRGRAVRELQAADVQVHERGQQRRMVRLVGREAQEVTRPAKV